MAFSTLSLRTHVLCKPNCHPWYFLLCPTLHSGHQIRGTLGLFHYMYMDWPCHEQRVFCVCSRKPSNPLVFVSVFYHLSPFTLYFCSSSLTYSTKNTACQGSQALWLSPQMRKGELEIHARLPFELPEFRECSYKYIHVGPGWLLCLPGSQPTLLRKSLR